MFNLGWLPGGDRRIVTRPAATIAALDACLARLCPGGRLSVVTYRGHPGGAAEAGAVAAWLARLPASLSGPAPLAGADRPDSPVLYRLRVDCMDPVPP